MYQQGISTAHIYRSRIIRNAAKGLSLKRQLSFCDRRINIEVLSVVAQQILAILTALSQKLTRFIFEGAVIVLIHTCGIFITMNPGYAGRTELPDNLKSMFRPISMMVPDSSMIAEISLFGEGFQNTRMLAKKVPRDSFRFLITDNVKRTLGIINSIHILHSSVYKIRISCT